MSVAVHHRKSCRLCDSRALERVVALNPIPLSEGYRDTAEAARAAPRFPVDVYMCADCGHVQQLDVIDPEVLWDSYTYFSGDAKGMPEHFERVAARIIERAAPAPGSLVVDIGSNDGSLLKPFRERGHCVLGIDPATDAARRANDAGIETACSLMTQELAERVRREKGPAAIVCAFNVFAHADDLGGMTDCARTMLADDGLFFFEAQYLLDIVDGLLIATMFHEHISHHSIKPLVGFFDRHGMELIAVDRARIQHGSIIGAVQMKGGGRPVEASVTELLELERDRGLDRLETMRGFAERVARLRETTTTLVDALKRDGRSIAAFGAARSGPTLIAQLGLDGKIDYVVDDHPQKVGKYASGDGLLILPTATLLEERPDYTVILAWVHSERIIETNRAYLEAGGHFVVLCPDTRVVGKDGDVDFSAASRHAAA